MGFQAKRIYEKLRADESSADETDHLTDLLGGYLVTRRHLILMRKYQQFRLNAPREPGSVASGVDARGRAQAHVE